MLYNGPLLCGFNVLIKGLITFTYTYQRASTEYFHVVLCLCENASADTSNIVFLTIVRPAVKRAVWLKQLLEVPFLAFAHAHNRVLHSRVTETGYNLMTSTECLVYKTLPRRHSWPAVRARYTLVTDLVPSVVCRPSHGHISKTKQDNTRSY